MSIFAIASPSPAAGRTTTAVGLATFLGAFGARVLLVDCDPEGDAAESVGRAHTAGLQEALGRGLALTACIAPTVLSRVDLMRAPQAGGASPASAVYPERLARVLAHVTARYSYVLVDCPAGLAGVTGSVLAVAHGLIMPVPCEDEARHDAQSLVEVVGQIQTRRNPRLQASLLMTMADDAPPSRELVTEMRRTYGRRVLETVIPADDLVDVVLDRQSLLDQHSPAARAYQELAMEVASRAAGVAA